MGLRRATGTLAGLALVAGSLVMAGSGTASACLADNDGDCYLSVTGTVTATAGLRVRAAPWGSILDTLPYQYSNTTDCYVQASDGSYWDWIYDTRIGRSGWVYDPYLYTRGNIYQQVDQMQEGDCGQWPLTTPAGVSAVPVSSGAIRVTWTDTNGGAAQYVVSNGNVSTANLAAGTTSYTWGGLAPGTYMCFFVAAKQPGGQSPWSAQACATTWNLSPPANVTASPTSTNSIQVTWSDTNGGAAQYVVGNGNTASADLAAGATSYTWNGLAAGTYMCFFVAAKQSGQQSDWSAQACATTPIYMNLGDSVSAGEGTFGPYDAGTDTSANMCHRSSNSYSGQYAAMSSYWKTVTNVACSGAVTADMLTDPASPNSMGVPDQGQLAQVTYLKPVGSKVGLVTLTIGANDLNVAGIVGTCLSKFADNRPGTDQCMTGGDEPQYPGFDDNFIANIQPTLIPRLEKVFAEIYKAAPSASIVVSTYPQIFPATYNGPCSEGFGPTTLWLITSSNELTRFRELTSNINAAIIAAAAVSTNVSVLPVENLFSGHELCTSDPWVNAVKGYINTTGTYDDESLHPTTAGYAAWASAVKNYFGF